jgi:DNA-binding MarR family transcriptional regulator
LLLLLGFRALIDDVHAELAEAGHAGFRPLHGVTFKAIGDGVTASELGRRLGVSKQAAGKTVEGLEREGYVERVADPEDARSKIIRLTPRGMEVQQRAFEAMAGLRARWAERLGEEQMAAIEEGLREMTADREMRFDIPGWFNG